jgi:Ca2+-binding RTX toxin-like protein
VGLRGRDVINGRGGRDLIWEGPGGKTLNGDSQANANRFDSADRIQGGSQSDFITGGKGR